MEYSTSPNATRGLLKSSVDFVLSRIDAIAFGLVTLLGLLRLPEPLWGDQALFLVGGKEILNGELLYRDFWDVKPPGIYGVYTLAGKLFGFSEVGMHLFDLIWMLALAVMLRVTLAGYFQRSWMSAVLAWMTVGSYFAQITPFQQMQVESMVNLPLYVVVWGLVQASQAKQQRWRWLVMAGIAGGLLLLFKLIYLPMLAVFWLVYLLHACLRRRESLVAAIGESVWPIVGILLPIIPVLLYWQSQGIINEVLYTMFQHPPRMMQELEKKPLSTLLFSVAWFVRRFFPLLLLAGYGLFKTRQRIDLLTALLLTWLALGMGGILSQSLSWWNYHFLLLLVPVGILGAKGLDIALRSLHQWSIWLASILVASLLLTNLYAIGMIGKDMVKFGLPVTPASQAVYQVQRFYHYANSRKVTEAFQRAERLPGDIFVMGEPIIYHMLDRGQAIPLLGWIPEMFIKEQWGQLISQLESAKVPYIFIEDELMNNPKVPKDLLNYTQQYYQVIEKMEIGTWYQLRG